MPVINAQGATFTFNGVKVNFIRSFTGFDGQATDIDITNLDSLAKEFRQGLQDFGNFSMDLQRDPGDAGQQEMEDSKNNQTTCPCVLTLPTGLTASFNAYVKQLSGAGAVDNVFTGTATLKISGVVVWA